MPEDACMITGSKNSLRIHVISDNFKVLVDVLIHLIAVGHKKSLDVNKASFSPLYSHQGSF